MTKKLYCTLFESSWSNDYSGSRGNAIGITWCYASASNVKWLNKSCWISFWSSWINKCSGVIDDVISVMWVIIGITWPKKVMLGLNFNHLKLTNKMVPLTVPSVSCHTGLMQTASHDQKSHHTLFHLASPNEQNNAIDDAVSIIWQQGWYQWKHLTKKWCFTSFWSLWCYECNGAIDNIIGIPKICLDIV